MDDGKNIYVMGYLDGETAVTNSDGSGYLLNDPELTDYLSVTMAGILKEKWGMELAKIYMNSLINYYELLLS